MSLTGIFGKLPAHGDFIHRQLPMTFINVWDEWQQGFIAGSKEQLGETWLDIYLTSPIWRFALSDGVIDSHAWLGLMMPSVDRVGRYFPISVIRQMPAQINPLEFLLEQSSWFDSVEEPVLEALDAQLDVDELMQAIDDIVLTDTTAYRQIERMTGQSSAVINMEFEEQSPSVVFPHLLDAFLSSVMVSYSVWVTRGSERVEPCSMVTQGLPPIGGIAAMLDGQWLQRNWPQPYKLNAL